MMASLPPKKEEYEDMDQVSRFMSLLPGAKYDELVQSSFFQAKGEESTFFTW